METPNVATAKVKDKTTKPTKIQGEDMTTGEKVLKNFSDAFKEMLFTWGLYEACNKALGIIFNEISRKYDDMSPAIMEVVGALEMSRGSIQKTRGTHKQEPKAKE